MTTALTPSLAKRRAERDPAGPLPTTATSYELEAWWPLNYRLLYGKLIVLRRTDFYLETEKGLNLVSWS
jgi:hypothetical protein